MADKLEQYWHVKSERGPYVVACEGHVADGESVADMTEVGVYWSDGGVLVARASHEAPGYTLTDLARVQARDPLRAGEVVVIYVHGEDTWIRRKTEFFDGRFVIKEA